MLAKRLDREDYWANLLRTYYPYGLNERKRKNEKIITIGKIYPPIPRYGERFCRYRKNRNCKTSRTTKVEFIEFFNKQLNEDLKHSFLHIRKYLDMCKKKTL